jgi:hypothetical protein
MGSSNWHLERLPLLAWRAEWGVFDAPLHVPFDLEFAESRPDHTGRGVTWRARA